MDIGYVFSCGYEHRVRFVAAAVGKSYDLQLRLVTALVRRIMLKITGCEDEKEDSYKKQL